MTLLKSCLLRIVVALVTSAAWVYYQFRYYLVELPRRRPPKVHTGRNAQPTGLWSICATYQRDRTSPNFITFISCLQDAGYNVIAVHDGPATQAVIDQLCGVCHLLLVRSHGGRDIGSYQAGTAFLNTPGSQQPIKQVLYCNDSVFVRPSTLRNLLAKVRDMPDDYIGVGETFDHHYHIHSWFFAVSNRLFSSTPFQGFWARYKPISNRRHAINAGEVRLTRVLVRQGVYPTVLYTASRVLHSLIPGDQGPDVSQFILLSNARTYQSIAGLLKSAGSGQPRLSDHHLAMLTRLVSDQSAMQNGTSLFNLLLLKCVDFPFLKKDLVYKDIYDCTQVERAIDHWRDDDAAQLPEIRGYFRSRDAMRWQNMFHRLLASAGVR